MHKILFLISVAGLFFSGYLAGSKLFFDTCAFNETCPYFFGIPACYGGFLMYLLMTIYLACMLAGKMHKVLALNATLVVASLGVLYAGYFTFGELSVFFERGFRAYVLGLPTCAFGLVLYVALVVLTLRAKREIA